MAPDIAAALLPVLVFLAILLLMDSFKLVPFRAVLLAVLAGGVCAGASLVIEAWLQSVTGLSHASFIRYVSPPLEETLKAVYVIAVLRGRRIAFLVDAAVVGFAVGTGFALVENIYYLHRYPDVRFAFSLVRGFGPAILHGTLTAVFAMLARGLIDRHADRPATTVLAGLAAVVAIHSLYNHFVLPPVVATCVLLVLLPLFMTLMFNRSERATREWVNEGLDLDVDLLNLIRSPAFANTRFGKYLHDLRSRFPGPVVADMFCLLQLELELSIRAKGMLMAREAGVEVPIDDAVREKLREIGYLHESIGPTGLLALKPLRVTSERDDWHRYLLEQAGFTPSGWRLLARLRALARHVAAFRR